MADQQLLRIDNPKKLMSLCRMCASLCEKSVAIFGPEGLANELHTKIQTHLPIKVSESDNLPCQLCYECTNILIQWDAAVLGSVAAEKKLRALQWQEQQSFLERETTNDRGHHHKWHKVSASASGESLCCSVCNRSGMDFRQLVNHLKTHDNMHQRTESQNESDDSEANTESVSLQDHLHDELLNGSNYSGSNVTINRLQPDAALEPVEKMELRSKSKASETKPDLSKSDGVLKSTSDDDDSKRPRRLRLRKRKGKSPSNADEKSSSKASEDCSGDPVVTSSTSTLLCKPMTGEEMPNSPENGTLSNSFVQVRRDLSPSESQDKIFKPKVRIISAESINQTLEERAKANQSTKILGTQKTISNFLNPTSRPVIPILPKPSSKSVDVPPSLSKTRIVVSSGIVKEIKVDGMLSSPKFLKLPDGRIIRLLGSAAALAQKGPGSSAVSKTSLVPPLYRPIIPTPSLLKHQIVGPKSVLIPSTEKRKMPNAQDSSIEVSPKTTSPEAVRGELSKSSPIRKKQSKQSDELSDRTRAASVTTPVSSPTIPSGTDSLKNKSSSLPLKVNVRIGEKTLVVFDLQPGPKHSAQRYKCSVCGKRNIVYNSIQEHAQFHSFLKNVPLKTSSLSSP